MIVKPRIKGFVCITSHPLGCFENVLDQVTYAENNPTTDIKKPKRVLVIGSSTGYGLASRISASFSAKAETLGFILRDPPKRKSLQVLGFTIPWLLMN